jgi:hypothetical protein
MTFRNETLRECVLDKERFLRSANRRQNFSRDLDFFPCRMKTILDAIARLNQPQNTASSFLSALQLLLESEDFDARAGRKSYVNWLNRCSSEGTLNMYVSESPQYFQTWFLQLKRVSPIINLAVDAINRNLSIVFSQRIAELYVKEYAVGLDNLETSAVDLLQALLNLDKRGSGVISGHCLAFLCAKLALQLPHSRMEAKSRPIKSLLRDNHEILRFLPKELRIFCIGLLFGSNEIPTESRGTSEVELDLQMMLYVVPNQVQSNLGIAKSITRAYGSRTVFPWDLFFIAHYAASLETIDLSLFRRVISDACSICSHSLDFTYIFYSLGSFILFENPRRGVVVEDLVVSELNGPHRDFFRGFLEFLVVQLRFGFTVEVSSNIRNRLKDKICKSLNRAVIVPFVSELSVLSNFLEFEPIEESDNLVHKIQQRIREKKSEQDEALKRKLAQTSSESELDKLINVLKTKQPR